MIEKEDMIHIHDIVPADLLESEIANGYVRANVGSAGNRIIYNYTEKAQFEKHWNAATINCRGIITDLEGRVYARPWKKFFNYGEGRLYIDDTMPVEVTDKMDGSLGILYAADGGYVGCYSSFATRGSLNSEQAIHASILFNEKYDSEINFGMLYEYTFLFEIIYPANRIVLDYDGMDDLVLLGAVHIERGYYLGPNEAAGILNWTGPVTKVFEYKTIAEAFAAPPRNNAEGYVVRSGTEMVKIKQVDYVELHRIVTNLNARTVWLQLGEGKTVNEICEAIPDEFHQFVKDTAAELKAEFDRIENEILKEYMGIALSLPGGFSRKEFAMACQSSPYKAYLFNLLDCESISGKIWQSIRPDVSRE